MAETAWPLSDQGYVDVQGGRVWYGVSGERAAGTTPLLAIHGGPGMSHDYLLPLTDLCADRPVIFYDQLDAGKSDHPNDPENWIVERFVAEIDAIRDALNLSVLSIFGNSWGGTVAAAYAAAQPVDLERLILSSPLIDTKRWIADNATYRAELPDDILNIMDECEANGETGSKAYEDAVGVFYERHLCRIHPWPNYVTDTFDVLNETCYAAMWGPNEFTCNGTLRDYDASGDLASINIPTLITCGEFDEATPASSRAYANMIPGAEFSVFKDASHLTFVEDRENYIVMIQRFLAN